MFAPNYFYRGIWRDPYSDVTSHVEALGESDDALNDSVITANISSALAWANCSLWAGMRSIVRIVSSR